MTSLAPCRPGSSVPKAIVSERHPDAVLPDSALPRRLGNLIVEAPAAYRINSSPRRLGLCVALRVAATRRLFLISRPLDALLLCWLLSRRLLLPRRLILLTGVGSGFTLHVDAPLLLRASPSRSGCRFDR
jgi:hypothetical protein